MIILCFYRHSDIPSLLVQMATRARGQAIADVPSHVGVWLPGQRAYYEATVRGVARARTPRAPWRYASIKAGDDVAACMWLDARVGDRYDWMALVYDMAGRVLPRWTSIGDSCGDRYDCSRLVLGSLLAAGLGDLVLGCEPRLPVTPNDLWRRVRP